MQAVRNRMKCIMSFCRVSLARLTFRWPIVLWKAFFSVYFTPDKPRRFAADTVFVQQPYSPHLQYMEPCLLKKKNLVLFHLALLYVVQLWFCLSGICGLVGQQQIHTSCVRAVCNTVFAPRVVPGEGCVHTVPTRRGHLELRCPLTIQWLLPFLEILPLTDSSGRFFFFFF